MPMTTTLYELSHEITDLMDMREQSQIDDQERNDWLISINFEQKLQFLFTAFQDKVENVCKFIRNLEVSSEWLWSEIQRLQGLQRQKTRQVDKLKQYLSMIMQAQQLEKYDAGLFKVSFRKSDAVMIKDEWVIPSIYFEIKETKSLDKNTIKEQLKAWAIIPWVFLEIRQNLQIK